jgi:hypothetical protein
MAEVTPVTKGTAGYLPPDLGVWGGVCALADNIRTGTAEPLANRLGLRLSIWYFASVGNADTWTVSTVGLLKGVKACAWQGEDPDDDCGAPSITAIDTTTGQCTISFAMQNAASSGWLWVLSAG